MRTRMLLALLLAAAAVGPASAQRSDNDRGGVATETQDRLANSNNYDLIWDLIGLAGLLGLLGLQRPHSDDSYHPSSIE
jgi:hypothetical protein